MRHGYFYVWTKDGVVYSRKYFQEDLEDFGRFEDQGASESGKSMAAIELENGKAGIRILPEIRG